MKPTSGIPCNEYYHTAKAKKDRIEFRFVNEDRNTPTRCTVRLGDTDPTTGEQITDVTIMHEYHKLADHQIYVNGKETKNRLCLEGLINDAGDSELERKQNFSVPSEDPFAENEPEEIVILREIAASLKSRLADVFEALLVQHAGGKEKISMTALARKWGVSVTQICKDRNNIIRMIRKAVSRPEE